MGAEVTFRGSSHVQREKKPLTPICELGVSESGVGESGSVGRVSSRAGPRGRWGGCQKTILSKEGAIVLGAAPHFQPHRNFSLNILACRQTRTAPLYQPAPRGTCAPNRTMAPKHQRTDEPPARPRRAAAPQPSARAQQAHRTAGRGAATNEAGSYGAAASSSGAMAGCAVGSPSLSHVLSVHVAHSLSTSCRRLLLLPAR